MIGKRKTEARRWFQQAYYDLKATRWNADKIFDAIKDYYFSGEHEDIIESDEKW